MELVQLSQLLAATGGAARALRSGDAAFRRVCIDSRQLREGEVFWALQGSRVDGHQFVEEAHGRGALACVVERQGLKDWTGPLVVVENTLLALADFARWYRQQQESLMIGVTGSVGKTTTREMIYAVLNTGHTGIRSQKNYNNELGVPLTLLDLEAGDEFAVLEMGARNPGDIQALARIAQPEVGVITSIGPAHLESFGDLEQVRRCKGELFAALPAHGFAVLSGDDAFTRGVASFAACPVIHVGELPHNQVQATNIESTPRALSFDVEHNRYEVPVAGRHYLIAALCAVAIGREVGLDAATIAHGLRRFVASPGRCSVEQLGPWTVIDDTYNANPTSMRAACELLRDWPGHNKRILVTGDMLELGTAAADYHRELGGQAAAANIDHLLSLGPHAEWVVRGAYQAGIDAHCLAACSDLDSLIAVLDCWLAQGDVVLVKGSRGMQMERVIEWLRLRAEEEFKKHQARPVKRACA